MGYKFANVILSDLKQAMQKCHFKSSLLDLQLKIAKRLKERGFHCELVFAINAERHFFPHFSCLATCTQRLSLSCSTDTQSHVFRFFVTFVNS